MNRSKKMVEIGSNLAYKCVRPFFSKIGLFDFFVFVSKCPKAHLNKYHFAPNTAVSSKPEQLYHPTNPKLSLQSSQVPTRTTPSAPRLWFRILILCLERVGYSWRVPAAAKLVLWFSLHVRPVLANLFSVFRRVSPVYCGGVWDRCGDATFSRQRSLGKPPAALPLSSDVVVTTLVLLLLLLFRQRFSVVGRRDA